MVSSRGRDFKAEFVRLGIPIYRVAAEIGIHPSTFSLYLNDKRSIPESLASQLQQIVNREPGE